jgi:hypothetical protein
MMPAPYKELVRLRKHLESRPSPGGFGAYERWRFAGLDIIQDVMTTLDNYDKRDAEIVAVVTRGHIGRAQNTLGFTDTTLPQETTERA